MKSTYRTVTRLEIQAGHLFELRAEDQFLYDAVGRVKPQALTLPRVTH